MTNQYLNKVWQENPSYIRRFYDNLNTNEKLCQEVKYILSTEMKNSDIKIAHISSRGKTLESFCEKICRKSYQNPFDDITDFAGVRIVYLYSTTRKNIEAIIENKFDVVEKVDKTLIDEEKFGYGALHYLVKIKNSHVGARYDELKNRVCEIQVRTILQDAWAIVAHHLSYKQESDVPKELRRKLNALSGLFETADDQFENIRDARQTYQSEVQKSIFDGNELPNQEEANIDELEAYLKSRFPERVHEGHNGVPELLDNLKTYGYSTLSDIGAMIDAAIDAVLATEAGFPPTDENNEDIQYNTVGLARTALCYMSKDYLKDNFEGSNLEQIKIYNHLVKKLKT